MAQHQLFPQYSVQDSWSPASGGFFPFYSSSPPYSPSGKGGYMFSSPGGSPVGSPRLSAVAPKENNKSPILSSSTSSAPMNVQPQLKPQASPVRNYLSPELQLLLQQPNGILNQQQVQTSPGRQVSLLEKLNPQKDAQIQRASTSVSNSPLSSSPISSFMENSKQAPNGSPAFPFASPFDLSRTPSSPLGSNGSPQRKGSFGNKQSAASGASLDNSSYVSPVIIPLQHQHQHFHEGSPSYHHSHNDSYASSSSESPSSSPTHSPPLGPESGVGIAMSALSLSPDEEVQFVEGTWKVCHFQQSHLLREFAVIPRKLVKKLVSMSEKENWGGNNEVLLNYLNYTFRRLIDEKKIVGYFPNQSSDKHSVNKPIALCFNAGLLTPNYERIYCFLAPNKNLKEAFHLNNNHKKFVEWFVTLFVKESDILVKKVTDNIIQLKLGCSPIANEMLPKRTCYQCEKTQAKELQWSSTTQIENIDIDELLNSMKQNEKLLDFLQSSNEEELASALKISIQTSIKRAEFNPRLAIPGFCWDRQSTSGEMQLMLPLDIDAVGLKCAVCYRVAPSGKYEVRGILSLNQAYSNARLIQKVDQTWIAKNL